MVLDLWKIKAVLPWRGANEIDSGIWGLKEGIVDSAMRQGAASV